MGVQVTDVDRNIKYSSIKEAWEVYMPQIDYKTFFNYLYGGRFPFLKVGERIPEKPNGRPVFCVEMNRLFMSTSEAAKVINGRFQGVQRSARSDGKYGHKGYHFTYAD